MTRISTGGDEKVGFFVCPSLKNLLGNEEVGIERSGELFETCKRTEIETSLEVEKSWPERS